MWDFQASLPSGVAVHTDGIPKDDEYLYFGRAGFAIQDSQIKPGALLRCFRKI